MKVLGIDPGYNGALALIEVVKVEETVQCSVDFLIMPITKDLQIDPKVIVLWLSNKQFDHIYLEHVHAIFGSSASGTFNFGRGFGFIEGLLGGLNLAYNLVQPKAWQSKVWLPEIAKLKSSEMKPKEKSYKTIKNVFPDLNLKPSKRHKHDHDGAIDAVLIALYGLKQNNFDFGKSSFINGVLKLTGK